MSFLPIQQGFLKNNSWLPKAFEENLMDKHLDCMSLSLYKQSKQTENQNNVGI